MIVRRTDLGKLIKMGVNMAWVRTVIWTSTKLSHAEWMKHFKKDVVPTFKDSPATSIKQVQTGPNSGLMILEFENKRALNEHEKLVGAMRETAGKDLKMKMTLHDGQVRWSR